VVDRDHARLLGLQAWQEPAQELFDLPALSGVTLLLVKLMAISRTHRGIGFDRTSSPISIIQHLNHG
jgi:hypothetical protein